MSRNEYPNYRWGVLGTLCTVQAATVAVLVAPSPLIGSISADMGLSLGLATGVSMVFHNVFLAVSAIFCSALIDRFGPYRIWVVGMALLIASLGLVPFFGQTLSGMLTIRALHGLAAGPVMATSPLVVAQWAPLGQRGIILGIQGTFVSVGAAISMLLVPGLLEKTGNWQLAMSGVGLLPVAALILSLAIAADPRSSDASRKGVASPRRPVSPARPNPRKGGFISATWAAALCGFWFSWSVRMVYDIIPNYLAMEAPEGIGMGVIKAGRIMAIVHIISMVGAMASGFLMEKCFRGRPRGLVATGFILGTFLLLPMGFPDIFPTPLTIAICVWTGVAAIALTYPLVLTFVSKYYPEEMMGRVSGLVTGASTLGTLVGLAAGAFALHLTGRYHVTILFICSGSFLGFLSSIFLKE